MTEKYDEERELAGYLWRHYYNFLTEFESTAGMAIIVQMQAEVHHNLGGNDLYLEEEGFLNDSRVREALSNREQFIRSASERILREHGNDVLINRCQKCNKIVASPRAKQCLWCGHDWH